ncbi:mRNA cap guanine-N7 methyltransferase [Pseudocyphellaria aurata]|nr:mRNA cap guanine-N7 methyltransferase [Pseudocyphellaria aurata]
MSAQGVKRPLATDGEIDEASRPRKRLEPSTSDKAPEREHHPKLERRDRPPAESTHELNQNRKDSSKKHKEEPKSSQTSSKETPGRVKRSPPVEDDSNQTPRPRKRPGGASRISEADKQAVLRRQQEREEEARKEAATRGVHDVVRQHYNAVPERGRDWRKTDSRIKGIRNFNNWVKSTVIHKFSPTEDGNGPPLRVLDLGCGKGGDLGKWQQAPQPVGILIGIDPAEISIRNAQDRYADMWRGGNRGGRGGRGGGRPRRTFDAEFFAQDAFGQSIANIPIVRNIGFDPGTPASRRGGGFDVVSMMFCMHYAFESEAKTRGMLQNVAGSLVKGGRFIGTIPNSDVIRSKVEAFHKAQAEIWKGTDAQDSTKSAITKPGDGSSSSQTTITEEIDDSSPRVKAESKASEINSSSTTKATIELDVQSSSSKAEPNGESKDVEVTLSMTANVTKEVNGRALTPTTSLSDAASKPPNTHSIAKNAETEPLPVAEWGNDIYRVRFPGLTPKDGVFRPPYGWKYSYFLEEAVEGIPEYVVPWEAFRGLAEDYNLQQLYRKPFLEVWKEEKDHRVFGPLSERMGVRGAGGELLMNDEEKEAASFYHAFCFYKV